MFVKVVEVDDTGVVEVVNGAVVVVGPAVIVASVVVAPAVVVTPAEETAVVVTGVTA